jgi:hypothetical protein
MASGRIVPEPHEDQPDINRKKQHLGWGDNEFRQSGRKIDEEEEDTSRRQARRAAGAGGLALDLGEVADHLELMSYSTTYGRCKRRMGEFLESPPIEMFIIFLVISYAILVCVQLVANREIQATEGLPQILEVIDVSVNFIFLLEITLKSVAFGQPYYSDPMNILDAFLVSLSMTLSLVTMILQNEVVRKVLSFRGVLRLLRLIVIFRRVSESATTLSKIKHQVQGVDLSSPVERVMDTLRQLQGNPRLPRRMRLEVVYASSVVSGGKLYEINLDELGNTDGRDVKAEASAWVADVKGAKPEELDKQKTFDVKVAAMGEYTLNLISEYGPEVQAMLEVSELERWDYDMFELDRLTKQNCLPLMTTRLLKSCDLWDAIIADNKRFEVYASRIRDGYPKNNPYHNAVHATDVMQCTFWWCNTGDLIKSISADALEFFSLLFAALVHDVGHPALNNVWHVKINHPIAVRYNDKAVLENMHAAIAYSIAFDDDANIFKTLEREKFDKIRKMVIMLVLATDMTQHFSKLGKLKTRVQQAQNEKTPFPEVGKVEDKELIMENVLHACDISNPARRTRIYLIWTDKVLKEFFLQGDYEKARGFAVSNFMDKHTTNIAKMQIGFINFVVTPLFQGLRDVFSAANEPVAWLGINRDFWQARTDEMEEQMKTCEGVFSLPTAAEISPDDLKKAIQKEAKEGGKTTQS